MWLVRRAMQRRAAKMLFIRCSVISGVVDTKVIPPITVELVVEVLVTVSTNAGGQMVTICNDADCVTLCVRDNDVVQDGDGDTNKLDCNRFCFREGDDVAEK